MLTDCPVTDCARPRHHDWTICAVCANALRQDLAELPALASDVHRMLTRYRSGFVSGAAGGDGLPFSPAASETLGTIRAVMVAWIRDLDENPQHHPADDLAAMARWLLARHDQLAAHPAADEVAREFAELTRTARRIIDGPPDRVFAGTCGTDGCTEHLLAVKARAYVTCPACGTEHATAERREAMEAELAGVLVTAAEFATLTAWLDWPLDRHRVRTLLNVWAHRGVITAVAHHEDGPRYRFEELRGKVEATFGIAERSA